MILPAIRLAGSLFTTVAGARLLAFFGLVVVCAGIGGAVGGATGKTEGEPTRRAMSAVEKRSAPPAETWLELREGYLVWQQAMRVGRRGSDTGTIYVPFVGKEAFEQWKEVPDPLGCIPVVDELSDRP